MNRFDTLYFETMRRVIGTPHWTLWLRAVALYHWARFTLWLCGKLSTAAAWLYRRHGDSITRLKKLNPRN